MKKIDIKNRERFKIIPVLAKELSEKNKMYLLHKKNAKNAKKLYRQKGEIFKKSELAKAKAILKSVNNKFSLCHHLAERFNMTRSNAYEILKKYYNEKSQH